MRKYEEYKESGIEWLGNIPLHWTVTKNKRVLKLLTDFTANGSFGDLAKNVQYLDSGYARLVRLTDLRLRLCNAGLYVSKESYDYLKKSSLKGGELVVANVGANVGTVCIVPKTEEIKTLGPNMFLVNYKPVLNDKYIYYLLCSDFLQYEFKVVATTTAQPKLNKDQFRSLNIIIPPINEQQSIANYLDTKTLAIDKKVTLLEQKIETYKKLKRTLINQTITKGLDKNATLKDSGISWIGQIPKHWEVKRFKDVVNKYTTGGTPSTSNRSYFEGSNIWISIGDIGNSKYISDSSIYLTDEAIKDANIVKTPKGSLLYSFKLSVGKMAFTTKDVYTNEAILSIFPNKNIDLEYYYFMLPTYLELAATENIYGAKMLNQKLIANALVIHPPKIEQEEIALYLDNKTATIDAIVGNITKQIETLKQFRKTLINDVVTGKIKVVE